MALGTPTLVDQSGASASRPTFTDLITFAGDSTYVAGGTADFEAYVAAAVGKEAVDVLYVINEIPAGAITNPPLYKAVYDRSADKLALYLNSTGLQVGDGDYSTLTLNLWVVYR